MRHVLLSFSLVVGLAGASCAAPASEKKAPRDAAPAARPGPTDPSPVAKPVPGEPAGTPSASACEDADLAKAFADLTSCNFKDGVIDFQCPALKKANEKLEAQAQENQAAVQITLMRLLLDSEERIRLMAARSLFSYAPQGAVLRLLIKAYGSEQSADVRSWIVYSLFSARDEAVATVLKALTSDPSDVVRSRAAQRLSSPHYARNPKVAEALLRSLKEDKSVEVRRRSAEAVGAMPLQAISEETLLGCLADKDIGPHCALGLGRMGSPKGYTAIRDLLQNGETSPTLSPLFVWAITDFQPRPFFQLEVISGILRRLVKSDKAQAGTRHYAVKSLVKLAQAVPDRKAGTVAFLKPLENDALLTHSIKPALEQLTAKPTVAPEK